jgi:CRP/FNR family transcriptional regulator, anaerobic regulatory protein
MSRTCDDLPILPRSCADCAIRETTVCGAIHTDRLDVLEKFKICDRIIPAHTNLYCEGDELDEIYNLLSGWVALHRLLESGKRQVLQIELPGAFLGYQADLQEPLLHTAECITDVAVCVFPRRSFPELLERHPGLGKRLVRIMAQNVTRTHDQLTNIGGRSGMERVAYFLLQFVPPMQHRQYAADRDTAALPLTQEMIGDALGLTSIHINRILRELRERHLVVLHNKTLQVLDLGGLRRMAEMSQLDQAEP